MNRKLKVFISLLLLMSLLLSQVAYAKPNNSINNNNGNAFGKENAPGQLKKVENYNRFEVKVKVGNKFVNFDEQPVIKYNRTLIPVRAVTEALGCDVDWIEPIAYITSPDEEKILVFDLENGVVYSIDADLLDELNDYLHDDDPSASDVGKWSKFLKILDTDFGLIGNRTFVPLRFIAEEFDLKVFYDVKTGQININEKPVLVPKVFYYETLNDVPDEISVLIPKNAYTFDGIKNLSKPDEFKVVSTTNGALIVTLYPDKFILNDVETKLRFEFSYEEEINGETVTDELYREFKIIIGEKDVVDGMPTIEPDILIIDSTDIVEETVTIDPNGYNFLYVLRNGILSDVNDYEKNGNVFTFTESFLSTLTVQDKDIKFLFSNDDGFVVVKLQIEFE